MKSVVLYAATRRIDDNDDYQIVTVGNHVLFIRTELRENEDVGPALDNATPRKGEIVLNSIPLDPERYYR